MIDFKKLRKASPMSRRMFIIKNIGEDKNVEVEYLFGLLNLYNKKNSGRWFWQKATFTGAIKDVFDKFNSAVDEIIKELKLGDEEYTLKKIRATGNMLEDLLAKLEVNLDVDRKKDKSYVKGYLDDNLRALIVGGLKEMEK